MSRIENRNDLGLSPATIIEWLAPHIKEERKAKIQSVVEGRMFSVLPVLEDIYDRGNISAVMRTSEGLGIANMDIIQTHNQFKESARVTQGADKWLDLRKWKSTEEGLQQIKDDGYKVYVTTLEDAKPMDEVEMSGPVAILFGNEKDGASRKAIEMADERIIIPMPGFTQSFNISVAAAISLDRILRLKQAQEGGDPLVTEEKKKELLARYYQKTVGRSEDILKRKLEETLKKSK